MDIKKYYMLRKLILEKIHTQRGIDFIKIDNIFIKEIEEYFKKAENDEKEILSLRKRENLDSTSSLRYFRAMERIEIRKKVIQLLLAIAIDKVPHKTDKFVLKQLYDISESLISLFYEKDVFESGMKEFLSSEFLINYMDNFKEYYDFNIKEIKNKLIKGKEENNFIPILESLFLSSLFWFTLREGDLRKIRESDLYIYLLSKKLIEEYKNLK
jgi:hypothetical protein